MATSGTQPEASEENRAIMLRLDHTSAPSPPNGGFFRSLLDAESESDILEENQALDLPPLPDGYHTIVVTTLATDSDGVEVIAKAQKYVRKTDTGVVIVDFAEWYLASGAETHGAQIEI